MPAGETGRATPTATAVLVNDDGDGLEALAPAAQVVRDDNDDVEDAEVRQATGAEAAGSADGEPQAATAPAAPAAAVMTGAEHEKRLELLRLLSRARAPILELAFFPKEVVAELLTTENREVTRAKIGRAHV